MHLGIRLMKILNIYIICIFPDVFKYMNCEVLWIYKKKRKGKQILEISSKEAIKKSLILVRTGEGMFGWLA